MRMPLSSFILVCISCVCIAGCSEETITSPPAARPARIAVVKVHKLTVVAQGAGRIQSRHVSPVGFEVGGRLISRDVDLGAVVKKGQKLAELSALDYQNKVTVAEGELGTSKAMLAQAVPHEKRYLILLTDGWTTRAVYEEALKSLQSAQAQVKASEANLRIAQDQLSYTQLLAPDDGVITAAGADPGQVVAPGQMIVEVSRNDELEAVFAVAGAHIARATLGMPVEVSLQDQPQVAVTGSIREISPEANGATGTYQVRVALPSAPPDMRLGAVVVGRVKDDGPQVATLPASALLQSGDKPQVWVVDKDGSVHRRTVELLEFDTDSVVVSRGLSAGEKVVTAGVQSLAEGQFVTSEEEIAG